MEMMGYLSTQVASMSVHCCGGQGQAFAFEHVLAVLVELAGGAVQADGDLLAGGVAGLVDGLQDQLDARPRGWTLGAKPPSSPTAVGMPLSCRIFFSAWNTSAPPAQASRKLGRPRG